MLGATSAGRTQSISLATPMKPDRSEKRAEKGDPPLPSDFNRESDTFESRDSNREELERQKFEAYEPIHQPEWEPPVGPKTPAKVDEIRVEHGQSPATSSAPRNSEKQRLIDMGYPAQHLVEPEKGKPYLDFGAVEDEALLASLEEEEDACSPAGEKDSSGTKG
jgi:hypothetical protein